MKANLVIAVVLSLCSTLPVNAHGSSGNAVGGSYTPPSAYGYTPGTVIGPNAGYGGIVNQNGISPAPYGYAPNGYPINPGGLNSFYGPYSPFGPYNSGVTNGINTGYPGYSGYSNYNVYGRPTLIGNNTYGINVGGNTWGFYRANSGYYYPWLGGYQYTGYPIFSMAGGSAPVQSLPPLSTMFADLNDYLDTAKDKGKVTDSDYKVLKQRAKDLLSKERSVAYESGGLDSETERDLRRDVDQLSAEVSRRVQP
jgi:hypothetical protein